MARHHRAWRSAAWGALALLAACTASAPPRSGSGSASLPALHDSTFVRLMAELSEPDRYFDTDNLISNEGTLLEVAGLLEDTALRGGAYLGVGPDQNFSYIARLRPSLAVVVDIRRDNSLLHLLLKAFVSRAETRADYLALLLARPVSLEGDVSLDTLLARVSAAEPDPALAERALAQAFSDLEGLGLPLPQADRETLRRFHAEFVAQGLGLRFRSHDRAPRGCYPAFGDLLLGRDASGRRASYLASEADYRVLRTLHRANRILPVTGDLAGAHALPAIARFLEERGERLSAAYVSNVELYLMRDGTLPRYLANMAALPRRDSALVLRSVFRGPFWSDPTRPAESPTCSDQRAQRLASLVRAPAPASYGELVTRDRMRP